jgi:hypothetical protein
VTGQVVRGLLLTLAVYCILIGLVALPSFEGGMGVIFIAMGATAVYWLNRWSKAAIAAAASPVERAELGHQQQAQGGFLSLAEAVGFAIVIAIGGVSLLLFWWYFISHISQRP